MVSSKNCDKSRNKGKAKRALMMATLASCGLRAGKVLATPCNSPRITRTGSSRAEEGAAASSASAAAVMRGRAHVWIASTLPARKPHENPQLNQVLTRIKGMADEELMTRFQPDPREPAYYTVNIDLIKETLQSAGESKKDDVAQAMLHRCFASNDSSSLVPEALKLAKNAGCNIPRAVVRVMQAEHTNPTKCAVSAGWTRSCS